MANSIFRHNTALELSSDLKAFLNVEAGIVRGGVELRKRADPYLDLMKRCLSGWLHVEEGIRRREEFLDRPGQVLAGEWPSEMHTMIGFKRLDNLQFCIESVLKERTPGDLIETGVWRGGATIFMRAVLEAYEAKDRQVWVADSFEGLPPPNAAKYRHDTGDTHHTRQDLAISLEEVRDNFERYGLLDDQVRFLKGWFRDTLPEAPIEKLAVIRLDGDMYESTMDGLANLYPRLSTGGYIIVDDYGAVPACKQAVHDYRASHDIDEEILPIDWTGVYWQRTD